MAANIIVNQLPSSNINKEKPANRTANVDKAPVNVFFAPHLSVLYPPIRLPIMLPMPRITRNQPIIAASTLVICCNIGDIYVYTMKPPAPPNTLIHIVKITRESKADKRCFRGTSDVFSIFGSIHATPINVINPTAATIKNVIRQPSNVPIHVPIGTPRTIPTVNPAVMNDKALPRAEGEARFDATAMATGVNKAAARAAVMRVTNNHPYDGTMTDKTLAMEKMSIETESSFFLGRLVVNVPNTGAHRA